MELKEAKTEAKMAVNVNVRGTVVTLDHAPTADEIEAIGFKHIGGKFHVYSASGAMVKKSEFPYTGGDLTLREYNAPAN